MVDCRPCRESFSDDDVGNAFFTLVQAVIFTVSVLSAILLLFFVGQIDLISSLVNFGALFGFMLLHVSVVVHYMVRKKSKNYLLHLVVPVLGFLIIGYVLLNANIDTKVGGIWLILGAGVFLYYRHSGRKTDLATEGSEGEGAVVDRANA